MTLELDAHTATSSPSSALRAGGSRVRCWSGSRPRPTTWWSGRERSALRKRMDLIVANDVSRADAGFDVETNAVTLVGDGGDETCPRQPRRRSPAAILDRVEPLLARVPTPVPDSRAHAHGSPRREAHLRYYAELGVSGFHAIGPRVRARRQWTTPGPADARKTSPSR